MIQRYEVCQWKHNTIEKDNGNYCLYKDVKKLEQELAEVKEANRWRDVKEELPGESLIVIIQEKDYPCSDFGYYVKDEGWWTHEPCGEKTEVTYWQPLPELKATKGRT